MTDAEDNDENSTSHMLTRSEVASRLGVSVSTAGRWESDRLHPQTDARGVWPFDPVEVDAIKRPGSRPRATPTAGAGEQRALARKGRVAALVFRLFARNHSLPQIVITTRQPPDVVRTLYHEWMTGLVEGEWERTGR